MEPVSGDSAPRFSRRVQVETVHGVLRHLLSAAAGRSDSDLPASQRERAGDLEGQRQGVDSDRRLVLSDLREPARRLCLLRHVAGRTAAGRARSAKQCFAALFVPAVFAHRVCAGQNVGAVDSAFGDHLGAAVVVVSVSVVSRRRGWFVDNLWIASAIFIGSVVWILLLALLSQAVSALVKWRVVASGALLGLFFIPSVFGEVVNQIFLTRWGNIISLGALMKNVISRTVRHVCADSRDDYRLDGRRRARDRA